jgi:hypothetical protein
VILQTEVRIITKNEFGLIPMSFTLPIFVPPGLHIQSKTCVYFSPLGPSDTFSSGFFLVLPNETILVGRDETRNHVAFADLVVSRCQLEIFSVVVDEQYDHPPLVFVRDRGSSNGTVVNGQLIGKGAALSPSRLLEDGDTITIGGHPHLRLEYTLLVNSHNWRPSYTLSQLQRQEVEVGRQFLFLVFDDLKFCAFLTWPAAVQKPICGDWSHH